MIYYRSSKPIIGIQIFSNLLSDLHPLSKNPVLPRIFFTTQAFEDILESICYIFNWLHTAFLTRTISKFAEIDTKPELEIYADDVVCAHGVTVGQLDENSLFYLRSRGISMETARSVLTYAFAAETLNAITVASLRQKVRDALLSRLPGGEQVKAFAVADFEDAK